MPSTFALDMAGFRLLLLVAVPLGLAALARLIPEHAVRERRVRTDVALALACAVVATGLAGWVTSPGFFLGVTLDGSDHDQYCEVVGNIRHGKLVGVAGAQRSAVAAALPALLATKVGVLDGLALAAVVSFGLLTAALYAWARVLAGRVAGVVAALSCAGIPFIVTLPRTLTFYPEHAAATVAAAAGAAAALSSARG